MLSGQCRHPRLSNSTIQSVSQSLKKDSPAMEKVPERANKVQVSLKQTAAAAATMSERGPSAAKNCFPKILSFFQINVGVEG